MVTIGADDGCRARSGLCDAPVWWCCPDSRFEQLAGHCQYAWRDYDCAVEFAIDTHSKTPSWVQAHDAIRSAIECGEFQL